MRSNQAANALVLVGSTALLGGALAFQYIGHLAPCEMCLWQRWPHVAALVLGLVAWAMRSNRAVVTLAALAVLATAAIGYFHAGVEYHWWAGPQACTAAGLASGPDFITAALATPMIRCDAAAWTLFGISMAGYNALFSTLIGGVALWLVRPSSR
ncbi:disulfide bond formation protein B [Polymorphobacter sp. PAMC 29334]|uniref:disulfide bond formation protein B n=1 Tax=Polymorphobacter sp. PAMC 29334 TaxID=2862331 RepID=UPI001C662F56|nr:disulfide bond formation protein B [Polymorphobacter sp. PAMC 29334]QYE35270.1 disulfide bond formation protein B [Polymorphobacter sp. PAMC 29334]